MGLFGKKKSQQERQEQAAGMLDDIANNRGFTGKLTNAFMGSDFRESMQQANTQYQQAGAAAQAAAAGLPQEVATVVSIQDTGQTINDNPSVVLVIDLAGQQLPLTTLVSRLQIPRPGDRVLVMREPQSGGILYAGLAPAGS